MRCNFCVIVAVRDEVQLLCNPLKKLKDWLKIRTGCLMCKSASSPTTFVPKH